MLVGIIGGGQLGRMLALSGHTLGLHFRFLDPAPDACVGQLGEHIVAPYDDHEALQRLADGVAVVTYEFENVPTVAVDMLTHRVPVYPPVPALHTSQDRLKEKLFFHQLGIPTTPFQAVESLVDLREALDQIGVPAILKTRTLGYDGKGQVLINELADAEHAWDTLSPVNPSLILEGFVDFDRELSIIAVRNRSGSMAFYPLPENQHRNNILYYTQAPAPKLSPELQMRAEEYAMRVLEKLHYVGVLAIELFQTGDALLANEMAPRVHNSGHWTIEGAETSQFENHLRAVLDLPLGDTSPIGHSAMVNFIGTVPDPNLLLTIPGAHMHFYDKRPRPGRKIGHVTVRASNTSVLHERLFILGERLETEALRVIEARTALLPDEPDTGLLPGETESEEETGATPVVLPVDLDEEEEEAALAGTAAQDDDESQPDTGDTVLMGAAHDDDESQPDTGDTVLMGAAADEEAEEPQQDERDTVLMSTAEDEEGEPQRDEHDTVLMGAAHDDDESQPDTGDRVLMGAAADEEDQRDGEDTEKTEDEAEPRPYTGDTILTGAAEDDDEDGDDEDTRSPGETTNTPDKDDEDEDDSGEAGKSAYI